MGGLPELSTMKASVVYLLIVAVLAALIVDVSSKTPKTPKVSRRDLMEDAKSLMRDLGMFEREDDDDDEGSQCEPAYDKSAPDWQIPQCKTADDCPKELCGPMKTAALGDCFPVCDIIDPSIQIEELPTIKLPYEKPGKTCRVKGGCCACAPRWFAIVKASPSPSPSAMLSDADADADM